MDKSRPQAMAITSGLLLVSLVLALSACGGGSSSSSTTSTLAKITLTPATSTISIGQQQSMSALTQDANDNTVYTSVIWNSSSSNVATVDVNGLVTGVAQGTTQITASSNNITSNTATVNVVAKVAKVDISPMSSSVAVKGTQQFTATPKDASGNAITGVQISWYCSFSGVATIDANGLVTGVAPGTVTIVASAGNVSSQPAALTVTQ